MKSDLSGDAKVSQVYVDLVYLNCMKLESYVGGPNYIWCDSVEEYLRYEQHRSDLAQHVRQNDMKVENKYYGNVVAVNRLVT